MNQFHMILVIIILLAWGYWEWDVLFGKIPAETYRELDHRVNQLRILRDWEDSKGIDTTNTEILLGEAIYNRDAFLKELKK